MTTPAPARPLITTLGVLVPSYYNGASAPTNSSSEDFLDDDAPFKDNGYDKSVTYYKIVVRCSSSEGHTLEYSISRRYSSFYTLHLRLLASPSNTLPNTIRDFPFPSKYNNNSNERLNSFETYLQLLIDADVLDRNVISFLNIKNRVFPKTDILVVKGVRGFHGDSSSKDKQSAVSSSSSSSSSSCTKQQATLTKTIINTTTKSLPNHLTNPSSQSSTSSIISHLFSPGIIIILLLATVFYFFLSGLHNTPEEGKGEKELHLWKFETMKLLSCLLVSTSVVTFGRGWFEILFGGKEKNQ